MNCIIMNKKLETIHIIDNYVSLICNSELNSIGDFELYVTVDNKELSIDGNYIYIKDISFCGIIDSIKLRNSISNGDMLIVKGKTLLSILNRRVLQNDIRLEGDIANILATLFDNNFINPVDLNRKIKLFKIDEFSNSGYITDFQFEKGDNLYFIMNKLATMYNIGIDIKFDFEDNTMALKINKGSDKSYSQPIPQINPFVVFSNEFENLLDSSYSENSIKVKNVAIISGSEYNITINNEISDMERREVFVDASNMSKEVDGIVLTTDEYNDQLKNKGLLKLVPKTNEFSGQLDNKSINYVYGVDFILGDIVEVRNNYGMESKSIISGLVTSINDSGSTTYPTFKKYEEV